jgi:hypothetical protein
MRYFEVRYMVHYQFIVCDAATTFSASERIYGSYLSDR